MSCLSKFLDLTIAVLLISLSTIVPSLINYLFIISLVLLLKSNINFWHKKFKKSSNPEKYILSALKCWRMSIDSQTFKISDKSFSPKEVIDYLNENSGTKISSTETDTQEETILELLLQNIFLKQEYLSLIELEADKVISNYSQFKTKKLSFILEALNKCLSRNNGSYLDIGCIVGESEFYSKVIKVLVKRANDHKQPNYEFIFLHLGVELPSKHEIEQKSIQLSKIAHEIKNIILVISNTCKQLSEDIVNYSSQESSVAIEERKQFHHVDLAVKRSKIDVESLKYISSLSDYLLFLIEDLNMFTKIENKIPAFKLEPSTSEIELIPSLNFCLDIFKNRQKFDSNKSKLSIKSKFECKNNIKIKMDETRLKQIVINLLSNAYKFTASGEVYLRVEPIPELGETKRMRISVSDTGTGISDIEQKTLFSPFTTLERNQTLNTHGSGLGLSIVKEFLQQAGSNLQCTSKRNQGTKFWFDVECAREIFKLNSDVSNYSSSSYEKTIILNNHNIMPTYINQVINTINSDSSQEFSFESKDLKSYIKRGIQAKIQTQKCTRDSFSIRDELSSDDDKTLLNRKIYSKFKSKNKIQEKSDETEKIILYNDTYNENEGNCNEIKYTNFSEDKMVNVSILKTERSKSSLLPHLNKNYRSFTTEPFSNLRKKIYQNKINYDDEHNLNESLDVRKKFKNIIICDDEKTILNAASNIIKKVSRKKNIDVHIIACCNGIECLNAIYQAYINREYIDVVFIDENMPFMRGSLVTNLIKTMSREKQINDILVYLVSADDNLHDLNDLNRRFPNCFNGIIHKPISSSALENIL